MQNGAPGSMITHGGSHAHMQREQQQLGIVQQQGPMLPEQQHKQQGPCSLYVEAWKHGKLTLGFSGGGFLLPYHLGVYQSLAAMGIVSSATPMAGSSAGSLVVSGIKAGVSLQQQMDSFMEAAAACRQGGVTGRLRKVLKDQLHKSLPDDAAQRCSDGTCWVSVTQVFPRAGNKLYGAFSSRQQLIKALLASCHLPRLSDGGLFTSYKSVHKRVFDGGFSNLCPVPPVLHASHLDSSTYTTHELHQLKQQQESGAAAHPSLGRSEAPAVHSTLSDARAQETAGSSNASSSAAAHAGVSSSSTGALATAPSSLLLHHRLDSTKGITTRLLYSKTRPKATTGPAHKTHSYSRAASTILASTSHASAIHSHSYSRSASMPQPHTGSSSSSSSEVVHPPQHASSSGAPDASSSGSSTTALNGSSSSSAVGHKSGSAAAHSSSSSAVAHSGSHAPQQGLWAQRRQRQQAEELLASSCEVTGPSGSYVAAPDWCAVRVCVLPAKHMHELPTMFRAPSADEVSIAVDMFQEWPYDLNETTALALEPQHDAFLFELFTRGQQDAASWAQQQGFPPEVPQRLQQGAADADGLRVMMGVADSGSAQQQQQQQQQQQEKVEQVGGGQQVAAVAAAGLQEVQGVLSQAGAGV